MLSHFVLTLGPLNVYRQPYFSLLILEIHVSTMLPQLALTAFCFQHRQPQTHSPRESYPNGAIHSLSLNIC